MRAAARPTLAPMAVATLVLSVALHVACAHGGVIDDLATTTGDGAAPSASPAARLPLSVTTRVEPAAVTIGTRFRYTMRIEADANVEVVLPVLGDRIGIFEIVDFGKNEGAGVAGAPAVVEMWYELVAYQTGAQAVPAVPIAYRTPGAELAQVEAPSATVEITSVLGDAGGSGQPGDVRDIKEAVPVRAPGYPAWVVASAAAGMALLALAAAYFIKRGRRVAATPAPRAHEIALAALERLQAERFVERGELEAYYVRLSAIVREYVEARFGLRAPEMTTDEFLTAAQRSRELAGAHRAALQEFLSEADLVKFARHVPSRERAERAWTAACELVQATRPPEEARSAAA